MGRISLTSGQASGMRLAVSILLCALHAFSAGPILLIGDDPGPWPKIFGSIGLPVNQANNMPPQVLVRQVEEGAFVVLEGASEYAEAFSIKPSTRRIPVRSIVDERQPKLPIIWEKPIELPAFDLPPESRIFARERWSGAPILAGFRRGKGAVLWVAATPANTATSDFPICCKLSPTSASSPPFRS